MKDHENNAEELQKATEELLQALHKVAEILYKQTQQKDVQPNAEQQAQQEEPNSAAQQKGDDVIDAEDE